ncbi:hypothetical protein P171DRAFT_464104 [Karstenula rhodostoma CBS 690.94]|uniref:Uncharacterized protein n=1 Tax=Karstenula rhodostoma CBS 690.94 TaxID=1392251 RepID=A0A9P4PIE7_9PLEO|nr:hypothetical protein P171DRAFT_464104 [Karstenula rhodostoma CBS 690.94]
MFGILRIGSEKDSVEFIEHAKGKAASQLGGYVFSHSACGGCRLKKVKPSHSSEPADNHSSRPKSTPHSQANISDTSGTSGIRNNPSALNNIGVDQEINGWEMAEIVPTTSNLNDLRQGSRFSGEPDYSKNELDDIFSTIAGLQPEDMQTNVFMLEDIGGIEASQPPSADAQSSFMDFGHARTSPSLQSHQNTDAAASDNVVTTGLSRARSSTDLSSCQCRGSILRVLAEIESKILSVSPSNMYAMLSYQRRTTAASNEILTSRICNCSKKFFGLLEIIGEKITSLSEAIIAAFVCRVKAQNDYVDFDESDSFDKCLDRNSAIRLGEFQVQTLQELKVVSAAVIKLQLKYSLTFVSRTRELAISMNLLAQAQNLEKLEHRLEKLSTKMQRTASDVESDICKL